MDCVRTLGSPTTNGNTTPISRRTTNRKAQEEDEETEQEQEITRLRTKEQRLKRKIWVLQSVNEETKIELEELREVVETLVDTVESSNGLGTIRPARLSCTSGLLEPDIPSSTLRVSKRQSCMKTIQDAHKRITSLGAQLTTHEAELAKSLVCLNGTASLGGRSALGKPSLGVALEVENGGARTRQSRLRLASWSTGPPRKILRAISQQCPNLRPKLKGAPDGLSRSVPGSASATRPSLDPQR
ncbi:hypothetical protein BKA70DRAFT_1406995 [Coprinopsis sp. MPI-PUGE-AT-0042]|nr:hypothetical protein BKA70DRAFT_1406995 [Coprinopsis sp. MPI-PUGE-AT-0042]